MNPLSYLSSQEYSLVIEGKKDLTTYDSETAFETVYKKISLLWIPIIGGEFLYTGVYAPHKRSMTVTEGAMAFITVFYPLLSLGTMMLYRSFLKIDDVAEKELRSIGTFIHKVPVFQGIAAYWEGKQTFYAKVCHAFYSLLAKKAKEGIIIKEAPVFLLKYAKVCVNWNHQEQLFSPADDLPAKVSAFFEKCWSS